MLEKFILKPYQSTYETKLMCSFFDKRIGRTVFLTVQDEIYEKTPTDNDILKSYKFDKNVPQYVFLVDSELKNFEKPRNIIKYLERDPKVYCEHLPDKQLITPLFELVNVTKLAKMKFEQTKLKHEVLSNLFELSDSELENVMYRHGISTVNKEKYELFNELADWNNGAIMRIDKFANKPKEYLDNLENADNKILSVVNKAIDKGIIEKEGVLYYLDKDVIGGGIPELVLYFKNNKTIFENYLVVEVDKAFGTKKTRNTRTKVEVITKP